MFALQLPDADPVNGLKTQLYYLPCGAAEVDTINPADRKLVPPYSFPSMPYAFQVRTQDTRRRRPCRIIIIELQVFRGECQLPVTVHDGRLKRKDQRIGGVRHAVNIQKTPT